jgi:hypothetical protein
MGGDDDGATQCVLPLRPLLEAGRELTPRRLAHPFVCCA